MNKIHKSAWALAIALATGGGAWAATTDIASVPLITSSSSGVKPNLMVILDDSGSMASGYMPDDANFAIYKYGFYASQCNGVAYNPSTTYTVPVDSTGATLTAGSFSIPSPSSLGNQRTVTTITPSISTGSKTFTLLTGSSGSYSSGDVVTIYDSSSTGKLMVGRVTSWTNSSKTLVVNVYATKGSGTLTLPSVGDSDNRAFYYTYTGTKTALSYNYTSSAVDSSLTDSSGNPTFYAQCSSDVGSTPGSSVFALVDVTTAMSDFQNYANWYTYYNTRMTMMRSASKLAFKSIGDKYRVGFSTISSKYVSGTNFLDIADFGTTQKSSFYSALDTAVPSSYTPLRGALAKAGQYFAKKAVKNSSGAAQTYDPVQYSCQRNYAILTTDGYWNANIESSTAPKYGPYQLDNTTSVGQQDGTAARPMKDDTVTTLKMRTSSLQARTVTPQYTQSTSALQTRTIVPQYTKGTSNLQSRTITPLWTVGTSHLQKQTGQVQVATSINGGASYGAWSNTGSCTWDTTGTNRARCQYVWSAAADTGSTCTPSEGTGTSGTWSAGTRCSYGPVVNTSASTCSAVAASTSSPYTVIIAVSCTNASTYGAWTNTSSCTTSSTLGCQYATPTTSSVSSCTAAPASTSSPYTVSPAVTCTDTTTYGAWTNATSTCTSGSTTGCQYGTATTATVGSCTPVAASSASPYSVLSAVTCTALTSLYGAWANVSSCTTSTTNQCQYTSWSALSTVSSCTALAQSTASPYTVGTATDCSTTTTGGSSNSLADVAMYYYNTDLRTTTLGNCSVTFTDSSGNTVTNDVCSNIITASGDDDASHQHMTTFTLGLGTNGTLKYASNYQSTTLSSGDFYDVKQGTKDWPVPSANAVSTIDDLWHAAVNGRGTYFSAGDPTALATSLTDALTKIKVELGFGSAAAASTLEPVTGDNSLFLAKYKSVIWIGDLVSYTINPTTGALTGPNWSAATQLQTMITAGTARNIYYFKPTSGANTGTLRDFTHANLTTDGLSGYFNNACSMTTPLTQCTTSGYNTTNINSGPNMVTYLRGGAGSTTTYRVRTTTDADIPGGILGDIVGGAPVYVGKPPFKYTENSYATFVSTNASRSGTVYVGANDGMLHAFNSSNGNERWAYIPSMVMSGMYRLADTGWDTAHTYFVNAAPVVGDIYVGGAWKTILVGGLGAGGKGYYALDITNPAVPVALWEFTNDSNGGNSDLGLTFGNPVITKRADGTWVVAFTSGYNNTSGDGNGHLYVVNANTGARLLNIPTYTVGTTKAGSAATPSGLGKISPWVETDADNTAKRFYGGDLLGNLWRFDIDNLVLPNQAALRLAYADVSGTAQPITTKPVVAEVTYGSIKYPVVSFGTGRYLGTGDLTTTGTQSIYVIKDSLTNTSLGNVHSSTNMVQQTSATSGSTRTITASTVDWSIKDGWRLDLQSAGERVNVDPLLIYSTLVIAGNVPSSDACSPGGSAFLYKLNIGTGATNGAVLSISEQLVGTSVVRLEGTGSTGETIVIGVGGTTGLEDLGKIPQTAKSPAGRRTSWRELVH